MILRRLYVYLVSMASLAVLAFGLSQLGQQVLLIILNAPDSQYLRTQLAAYTATVVVALPVWAIHLWLGQRFARRDPAERASALRRLYLYLACGVSAVWAATALSSTVATALLQQLDDAGFSFNRVWVAQSAWVAFVLLVIWALHYWIAARDRAAVGESGASATLRRWYMYVALIFGLFMMLAGAQAAIQVIWVRSLNGHQYLYPLLSSSIGELVGGSLLWGSHAFILATRHLEDDRKSTLRAVEGFVAIAICIVAALVGASELLYYGLARYFGIDNPAGLGNDLLAGLAQPTSSFLVYGIAWFLIRRRLARDTASGEAARQAGIRRLYTNLVALVSVVTLAAGAAALLGTLAQLAEAPLIGVPQPDWKNPISVGVPLFVLGGLVWLAHWRPDPWLEERHSLSRRLYLWAALLASVLAVLGGGITMLYIVFQQVFSTQPRLNDPNNLVFGGALAVVVVAAGFGVYHWRVMRSDGSMRVARTDAAAAPPPINLEAPAAEKSPVVEAAPGRHYELSVVGASEDDVHQALANLPPQASYKLTASDRTARK